MYQTESKKGLYIVLILAVASMVGWVFLFYYRPVLIEASCSDIANNSTNLFNRQQNELDPNYNYDYLKSRCLEDAKYAEVLK
ncbi:hypothetical protein A3D01_05690 [Candidatus Woesebacteria bacterium RIFCSPHIGHO2_02_FULL_39_13]|uniref:Uncharacterized protein n=1 Tax=Candidatus Woesebacteria bacterium RIFCSPHIGHO2_02_FULL_39_13 TaxID=1802505 RepID=A0A1F7Z0B4_9BACT|nr:MAG: hypothetical protein A3D01_05690 [Candidatus Woesebacteria bacterium RIFCSPHIGHO2_02_FULL_39_13]OGM75180.1 MAG: hypothetical protein A3H19_06065 [Candidatus Woesebacteria bacterium RIFCSPLOWO2_12_FULL_39_9]